MLDDRRYFAGLPVATCGLGLERDRLTAVCKFCDTDFVGTDGAGGGKFKEAKDLAAAVSGHWPNDRSDHRLVVCTGGEPLLQLDEELCPGLS